MAGGGAAIAAQRVAVVALLSARGDAVAALGRAGLADHPALISWLDGLAVTRAAIAAHRVAVVAFLVALEHAVPALDHRTDAQLARGTNAALAFGLAVGRAPVPVLLVAVVAHFANRRLDNAVTAPRGRLAGIAWRRAHPTGFELTSAAAAIAAIAVAVVAVLARLDALVATLGN